ncbi:MAG: fatty acid--CoA ligase family protein [Pseudomonadota bacterium]
MASLIKEIGKRQIDPSQPFMLYDGKSLSFSEVLDSEAADLSAIQSGDVVAVVGDFDPISIRTLLELFDRGAIVVPLSPDTRAQHEYYIDAAKIQYVVEQTNVVCHSAEQLDHPYLSQLRADEAAGLVLFSSGTTGRPKAILHDFRYFQSRFHTPRPALKTLNFLLFDHIGGLNTLFHTLFNNGIVVVPSDRSPAQVISDIEQHDIELLPTTPTFLRMLLISGLLSEVNISTLKIITYGTERMDQSTLDRLCRALPDVDFRQTFGMSELGILRVKSKSRNSLWMSVGGEGVELKIDENNILKIRTQTPMLGYMNADSPFDEDGWYNTKDIVEQDGDYIKVVGRDSDVINIGGLKILPSEIERVAMLHPAVALAKAEGCENPLTGQHIECTVQLTDSGKADKNELKQHFRDHLPTQFQPRRIRMASVGVNHRFKREG